MDALSDADLDGLREHLNDMITTIIGQIVEGADGSKKSPGSDENDGSADMDTADSPQQDEEAKSETTNSSASSYFERASCSACRAKSSPFWRRVAKNKIVCNKCFFDKTYLLVFSSAECNDESEGGVDGVSGVNSAGNPSGSKDTDDPNQSKEEPFVTVKITRSQAKKYEKIKNGMSKKEEAKCAAALDQAAKSQDPEKLSTLRTRKSARAPSQGKDGQQMLIKAEEADEAPLAKTTAKTSSTHKLGKKPGHSDIMRSLDEIELMETALIIEEKLGNAASLAVNTIPSRRTQVFKKDSPAPTKSELLTATICTSDYVFHRGFYMQVGDIVALFDDEDHDQVFFAQIRAFMIDQFGQKSAVLTWLVPTEPEAVRHMRTAQDFRVDLFVPGPAEEFPRPLECMEFVCRLVSGGVAGNQATLISRAQYENDLLRHKFSLSDQAASNAKLVTKLVSKDDNNSAQIVEHQIV